MAHTLSIIIPVYNTSAFLEKWRRIRLEAKRGNGNYFD